MKECGNYIGSLVFAVGTKMTLGDLTLFAFWQRIMIGFFILAVAIVGGILGTALQSEAINFWKWISAGTTYC